MYLTRDQIAMYAAAAGAANPQVAAAVAMAESGGNTGAHNVIPPDDSYGLWQINMRGDLGPARRKQLGIGSNAQLYDPATNARAMVAISGGGSNFAPWTAYTSGRYEKYLPAGVSAGATPAGAVPAGLGDIPGDIIGGTGDLLGNLWGGATGTITGGLDALKWLVKAGEWLGKASNWVRISYVIGGGALVVVGLAMVVKDQELGVATKTVGRVLGSGGKSAVRKARSGGSKKEGEGE